MKNLIRIVDNERGYVSVNLLIGAVIASFCLILKTNKMDELILKKISAEIEQKYDCKVISIRYAQLLSLCVMVKIQFNEDFLYKPFESLPTPETICFSERSINFTRRVDLYECVKQDARLN